MSYNGVGLRTARGSGTNGYVMRNLSYVKPAHIRERERQAQLKYAMLEEPHNKQPVNKEILLHEKKRQVEVKVMELRDELEEQGCDEDEIEEKCAAYRVKVQARIETDARRHDDSKHASSHAKAMRKAKELAALKDAFGIRDTYVEGTSFDVDLQEQRRLERMNEYDRKQREREERSARPRLTNNDAKSSSPSKSSKKESSSKEKRRRRRSPSSSSSSSSSSSIGKPQGQASSGKHQGPIPQPRQDASFVPKANSFRPRRSQFISQAQRSVAASFSRGCQAAQPTAHAHSTPAVPSKPLETTQFIAQSVSSAPESFAVSTFTKSSDA
ncbi:hypothetical protein DYB30_008099 [Aphanomyces astaci]|uniref:CWF21 domain-containing protein n=1 Tax=Aphanomyces astaci TaxID=112090 RepID=A0A397E396_APHAT|nr:hypothetical protein DYB30_008099 [Aphanomyces astaci]